jgi:hypothetical protein
MDLIRILNEAIKRLPPGEHTPGLTAIMRHIEAAIRHFEKDDADQDCFTDAIYRTNQAFEGSLKEAYRTLAARDPHGMSPHQIENYFETNAVIRPRVLTQLTRYRQDYRNPSTHDYKLDFDEDEALLAIVSVCAFTKLLVDQISEKLAFNAASSDEEVPDHGAQKILQFTLEKTKIYLEDSASFTSTSELKGGIAGTLSASGADIKIEAAQPDGSYWDILISKGNRRIAMEIRRVRQRLARSNFYSFFYAIDGLTDPSNDVAVIVFKYQNKSSYKVYKTKYSGFDVYLVSHFPLISLNKYNKEKLVFEDVKLSEVFS